MSTTTYDSSNAESYQQWVYDLTTSQKQEFRRFVFNRPTSKRFVVPHDEIVEIDKMDKLLMVAGNAINSSNTFSLQYDEDILSDSKSHMKKQLLPYLSIKHATKVEDVIHGIRMFGFNSIAERLTFLHKIIEEEQIEKPIAIHSLQNFAAFIILECYLPVPDIGINPNGLVQAVWRISNHGTLVMNFLTSGDIMFATMSNSQDSISSHHKISGVMPPHKIMYYIKEFVDKLAV